MKRSDMARDSKGITQFYAASCDNSLTPWTNSKIDQWPINPLTHCQFSLKTYPLVDSSSTHVWLWPNTKPCLWSVAVNRLCFLLYQFGHDAVADLTSFLLARLPVYTVSLLVRCFCPCHTQLFGAIVWPNASKLADGATKPLFSEIMSRYIYLRTLAHPEPEFGGPHGEVGR